MHGSFSGLPAKNAIFQRKKARQKEASFCLALLRFQPYFFCCLSVWPYR